MKIRNLGTGLLLAGAFALTSQAYAVPAHDFDLSGMDVDGAAPTILMSAEATALSYGSIEWDFSYTAGGTGGVSWGNELGITVAAPDGTQWFLGSEGESCTGCDYDFGFPDEPSPPDYTSAGSLDITGGSPYGTGNWTVTLFESFDDAGIDGTFTIDYDSYLRIIEADDGGGTGGGDDGMAVPEPGILALLGLGLLGMVGARRRRV